MGEVYHPFLGAPYKLWPMPYPEWDQDRMMCRACRLCGFVMEWRQDCPCNKALFEQVNGWIKKNG